MELCLKDYIRAKYESLWNEVVSIRINLLDGKLRQFFENILNVNKITLNQFYEYFTSNRTFCLRLPINAYAYQRVSDFNVWVEMIEKFDGDNVTTTRRKEVEIIIKNDYFQCEMAKVFDGKGSFKKAPVKTFDRCLTKSS